MLTLTAEHSASLAARGGAEGQCQVEVLDSLAAAGPLWRELETTGVASPYQRIDWIAAHLATAGDAADLRVVAVRDRTGRLALLLPVMIERRQLFKVAVGVGGKHANFVMPLTMPGSAAALPPEQMGDALRRAGSELGVDAFVLAAVPRAWDGEPSPLAAFGQPSPSNAYQVTLEPDADATFARSMTNEARKRLRNKERGLAKLGAVSYGQARNPEAVEHLLTAFFRQKEDRFRDLGIADPFLDPDVREFIRRGATEHLGEGRPPIEVYGLSVGDRVVAVLGGAADRNRLSGMFLSFEPWEEAMKYSPGDLLLSRLIRDQCERGRRYFDLGVGEARYKRIFCDETVELVDIFLPVSPAGRAYAGALRVGMELKRRLKQNPQAMRLLATLRRAKAGVGS